MIQRLELTDNFQVVIVVVIVNIVTIFTAKEEISTLNDHIENYQ